MVKPCNAFQAFIFSGSYKSFHPDFLRLSVRTVQRYCYAQIIRFPGKDLTTEAALTLQQTSFRWAEFGLQDDNSSLERIAIKAHYKHLEACWTTAVRCLSYGVFTAVNPPKTLIRLSARYLLAVLWREPTSVRGTVGNLFRGSPFPVNFRQKKQSFFRVISL